MKSHSFTLAFIIFNFILSAVNPCYGEDQSQVSNLQDLLTSTDVSLNPGTQTPVNSIFLSEPAIAAYFAAGTLLIGKLYSNWLKENKAIDAATLRWLSDFNKYKTATQEQHPALSTLQIEYLAVQKMQGKDDSLASLSFCSSCGVVHGAEHHHSPQSPTPSIEEAASADKEPSTHESRHEHYEASLNQWLKVMHEVGSLSGDQHRLVEGFDSFKVFKEQGKMQSQKAWNDNILKLLEEQIDTQLDWLQDQKIPLKDLEADFKGSPLLKLRKMKAKFFTLNRKHIKNFLMGGIALVIRSGKFLVWDSLVRPAINTFKNPRSTIRPFIARSRVSSSERGRLSSLAVGVLGGTMFFAYEFLLHGILHIHVACNHSLQFSLAMASAGIIFDVARQPFLIARLLPAHFNLAERAKLGGSVALAKWQIERQSKRASLDPQGRFAKVSHKKFMEHIGKQLASRNKLLELYLSGPLRQSTTQLVLDRMYNSSTLFTPAPSLPGFSLKTPRAEAGSKLGLGTSLRLAAQLQAEAEDPAQELFRDEIEKIFSNELPKKEKQLVVSKTLAGLRVYGESIYHSLIQMSLLTRLNQKELRLSQAALGRIRRNLLLVEEFMLIASQLDSDKARIVFQDPESLAQELQKIFDNLTELRSATLKLNRDSAPNPSGIEDSSRSILQKLAELVTFKNVEISELERQLRSLITKSEDETKSLKKARLEGFGKSLGGQIGLSCAGILGI